MKRILRFTASWCGPCKALAKTLDTIQTTLPIEVIDIDENREFSAEYGIRGVPTMVMLDENIEVKRFVGLKSKPEIETWLNS